MHDAFEWDDTKAEANFRKHGVDFEAATDACRDPFGVERPDTRMDYGETRYQVIGRSGDKLLMVTFTERDDRIRIISARKATRREHGQYYCQNTKE